MPSGCPRAADCVEAVCRKRVKIRPVRGNHILPWEGCIFVRVGCSLADAIVGFCQEYNDVTFSIYITTMHHRSCKHVLLRLSVILVSLYLYKKLGVHAGCMYVIYIKYMAFAHLTLVH